MAERQTPENKKTRRFGAILCLVSALACLLSFSSMIVVISYKKVKADGDSDEAKLKPFPCVNCDDLSLNGTIPDSDQLLAKFNSSQNSNQCCVENSEQMSAFLQLMTVPDTDDKERSLPSHDPGNFSMSKASAHKRLTNSQFSKNEVLLWTSHNHHLHMSPQLLPIEHINNVIVIPSEMIVTLGGYYQIYASVEFKQHSPEFCENLRRKGKICTVFVMLKVDEMDTKPEIILQTDSSCCGKTSYTAGAFHLHHDNRLYVELSMHGGVKYNDESTFLGIFMI